MKPNIRLDKLFAFAKVKSIRGLLGATDRSGAVFQEVISCYRKQLSLCGYLLLCIQIKKYPCFFSADDPLWISEGFNQLDSAEFRLLELLLEKAGHSMAISKDGIICSSPIENIRPLTDFRIAS